MKTEPIVPAEVEFGGAEVPPRAPRFDDLYHPRVGAFEQAQHVFLQGNGLPARWSGRRRFVIVETGFGLGNNFLATWAAWRADAARCEQLDFVSVEKHPLTAVDLALAHQGSPLPALAVQLQQAWPPLTPNLHTLDFEGGRVRLLLALGDVARLLPALRLQADAFFLDGFAPARNPEMWQPRVLKALGRLAAPGATLATWSVAREVRDGLLSAGFAPRSAPGIGGKREITLADWQPRHVPPRMPDAAAPGRDAVVVGGGLAGAAVAQALARAGMSVTVLERHGARAEAASGNLAGIFHGTVNGDDGTYARLFRTAALLARHAHAAAIARGVPGQVQGLLRLESRAGGWPAMQALLQRQGLPPEYVQALPADAAAACSGVPLATPAWLYPGAGWVGPAAWVREALSEPGVRLVGGVEVRALVRRGDVWQLLDGAGRLLAEAPTVVLAPGAPATELLAPLGHAAWPLAWTRGQVTMWSTAGGAGHGLRLPLAGDGYAIPLPDGLLCGATREPGTPEEPLVRHEDHLHNIGRLQRLTGIRAPADPALWQGRTGWRLHADDRLPVAGALPCALFRDGQRLDQPRLLPRERGLFVLTALGARGLTLAPLLAQLIAAQATGAPWPLEQDLADAVDPARWRVRAARAAAGVSAAT